MAAKPIPDGYHSVTPYLILNDAAKAIDFYKAAFGAIELFRLGGPGGKVGHAEIKIGDSPIMLADEVPEMGYRGAKTIGATPVSLMVYVENCDAVYSRAIAAGATEQRPVKDQFYGDRCGTLVDPFGHIWSIATHKEDLTPAEIDRRFAAMMAGGGGA